MRKSPPIQKFRASGMQCARTGPQRVCKAATPGTPSPRSAREALGGQDAGCVQRKAHGSCSKHFLTHMSEGTLSPVFLQGTHTVKGFAMLRVQEPLNQPDSPKSHRPCTPVLSAVSTLAPASPCHAREHKSHASEQQKRYTY